MWLGFMELPQFRAWVGESQSPWAHPPLWGLGSGGRLHRLLPDDGTRVAPGPGRGHRLLVTVWMLWWDD